MCRVTAELVRTRGAEHVAAGGPDAYFAAGELRKSTAAAYAALDELEQHVGANGLLQLKLSYPGTDLPDVVWEQLPLPWSVLPPLMRNVPLVMPAAAAGYTFWAKNRLSITNRKLGDGSACEIKGK